LFGCGADLKKIIVTSALNLNKVWHWCHFSQLAKAAADTFTAIKSANGICHGIRLPLRKKTVWLQRSLSPLLSQF